MRRRAPRPASHAFERMAAEWAPATALAAIQRAWPEAVGDAVARESEPVSERGGVVTISCRSAVWAQELDLMGPDLIGRLNAVLEQAEVTSLRCVATPPRQRP